MNKLWLIIKREYLTKVMRKQFLLITLLTPLGIGVLMVIVTLIMSYQSDNQQTFAIVDKEGMLNKTIKDDKRFFFKFVDQPFDSLKKNYKEMGFDGIIVVPGLSDLKTTKLTVFYYSDNQPDLERSLSIESIIRERLRDYKVKALNLDEEKMKTLDVAVTLDPKIINPKTGEIDQEKSPTSYSRYIGVAIGGIMGFFMYMMVFINGMMVMKSVMEEKINRIVEIMISTVKPFQLMLGKLIGVGFVGITQILIWAITIPAIGFIISLFMDVKGMQTMPSPGASGINPEQQEMIANQMPAIIAEFANQNWFLILSMFIIFFILGYLLYSSLFAAVGAAVGDDIAESQSLTFPISIPVLLAFYISFAAVKEPNSSLAVWSSIFPLFSPIVMPARLAFNPPWWQLVLSIVLLAATVLFFVWMSGRIFRVGILMYGKKATFKELAKWIFQKE